MKKKLVQIARCVFEFLPYKWKLRFRKTRLNKTEIHRRRREFYLSLFDGNNLYFDVGANLGNRIEPIIFDDIKIVAVEPQPHCIDYLKYKFGKLITMETIALGAQLGTAFMYIADSSAVSTLSTRFIKRTQDSGRFVDVSWDREIEVELKTLDSLVEKYGMPGFIKIDVEGYEKEVLKGLSIPVPSLSIEYTLPELKEELISCFEEIDRIYMGSFYFNYAPGEELIYGFENYRHSSELQSMFEDPEFNKSGFGDIYVKKMI
jgi:FkbM family methyltransferase